MKRKIIIGLLLLVFSAVGAATFVISRKSKVGTVSENPSIPMFITNFMTLEKQKVDVSFVDTSEAARIQKLGFTAKTKDLISASSGKVLIEYYKVYDEYYKNNQFVNFKCIYELMTKYNISLGEVNRYIGDIPRFAIDSMERFKVIPYFSYDRSHNSMHINPAKSAAINDGYGDTYPMENLFYISHVVRKDSSIMELANEYESAKKYFLILAPPSKFEGATTENGVYADVKDPIVLAPVDGGYIIVCSW